METNPQTPRDTNPQTGEVWSAFSADLRGFIRRRVNNLDDAEDVLQDVFVRIHRGLPSLTDTDRLLPWVYRITRNAITDRSRKHAGPASLNHEPEYDEPSNDDHRDEIGRCLNQMLLRLPQTDREALKQVELDDVSQREFADRAGISISGAKSRVQRARRRLKSELLACCEFQFDRYGQPVSTPLPPCKNDCGCREDPK
jgi:RNA polymerase sigma-70 factor (ECF subfamily)